MTDQAAFGLWLRRRRASLALTRDALSRRAHCSASSLRRLESGDLRPGRDLAQALAAALEIPPEQQAAFIQFARGEAPAFDLAPSPNAPAAPASPSLSLPAPLTSFVGRRREVTAIGRLLAEPDVRLVSLTGPPGAGKTRLSLAVAQQAAPAFPDGVHFVALAPLREAALVLPAVARALAVREPPGGADGLLDALRTALRAKRLLLVLDNFEHVVEAGPLVTDLLSAAPGLKVLVTTREPLHVYGEHEFPVPALDMPDVRRLPSPQAYAYYARYAALQLFQQRARAVQPGFKLTTQNAPDVARICAWLDGLPLAIEMAAAQVKWLPTDQLFLQLSRRLETLTGGPRDLSPRQQSLAGAIDWSYHLLSPAEQHLFIHLGVFVGGCDVAAVAAVSGVSSAAAGLQGLVEKSLLRYLPPAAGEPRYELLESLREYALERLGECGELPAAREAHARHYAALAQAARPHLIVGGDQAGWLNRLETEHDNLRAALAWSIETPGQAGFALELAEAIGHFWNVRGYVGEARARVQAVLALEAPPTTLRGSVLNQAGWLAQLQGDHTAARDLHQQALALHQSLDDKPGVCRSLESLAILAGRSGDYAFAADLLEQSLAVRRQLGDPGRMLPTLNNLALANQRLGNAVRAEALYRECADLCRALGNDKALSHALHGLAEMRSALGDQLGAAEQFRESIAIRHRLGNRTELTNSFSDLAQVLYLAGHLVPALQLISACLKIRADLGLTGTRDADALQDQTLASIRATLGDPLYDQHWAQGQTLTLDEAVKLALTLPT